MSIKKNCLICKNSYLVKPSRAELSKYCSKDCMNIGVTSFKIVNCSLCGKNTKKFNYQIIRFKKLFCSNECKLNGQKNENHPKWGGGRHVDSQGYWYLRVNGKAVYEHRIIMKKYLGRELKTIEHVHHINENKLDNRVENLKLVTNSMHQKLHGMVIGWAKKFNACIECGTNQRKHYSFGLCKNCYMRDFNAKNKKKHTS